MGEKSRRTGVNAAAGWNEKAPSELLPTLQIWHRSQEALAAGETVKGWIWAAASGTSQLFIIWTWPADDPPVGEMELWKNKSTGTEPSERRDEPRDESDQHLQRLKQQWTVYLVKGQLIYCKKDSHSVFLSCFPEQIPPLENDEILSLVFWKMHKNK